MSFLFSHVKVLILVGAVVVVGGGTVVVVTGGGSTPTLASSYLNTDSYGSSMFALRLVQHGAQLTGTAEVLLPVTSKHANEDKLMTVLDKNGNPLPSWAGNSVDPATGHSDNGACGGTSACINQLKSAMTGQVGGGNQVSIRFPWGTTVDGNESLIATRNGSDLVFNINGANAIFHPSDEPSIQLARAQVFSTLPMVIQTANLEEEAEYLNSSDAVHNSNSLEEDASGLKTLLDEANQQQSGLVNPVVCEFQQRFADGISQIQQEIKGEAQEVQKARNQLKPYLQQGSTLAAYGKTSGYVSELQSAIDTEVKKIDTAAKNANTYIGQANQDAPKIINVLNGIGCYVQHAAEFGFHLLPNLLAAG